MEAIKCIGIWMDHSKAVFIEPKEGMILHTIESEFTHQKKIDALSHSESGMHHKERQKQTQFYGQIAKEILKYDKVLLFGPTDAKSELHNYLMKDDHFNEIEIEVQAADKMTDKQQLALVNKHFHVFVFSFIIWLHALYI